MIHVGQPPEPHDLWTSWSLELGVIVSLAAGAWLYSRGVRALWRRAGAERGITRREVLCFTGGIGALVVALVSPIDAVGSALFSVHMLQHLLLVLFAAPLLALGAPSTAFLWSLPLGARLTLGRWWRSTVWRRASASLLHPASVWMAHTTAIWMWHAPILYDAALRDRWIHAAEHASFLVTGYFFWRTLVEPVGRGRFGRGAGMLFLFGAAMQSGILGALITFATRPWYPVHYGTTRAWGLTPLEDQQVAGLLMWIPASVVYLVAIGVLLNALLATDDRTRPGIQPLEPYHST